MQPMNASQYAIFLAKYKAQQKKFMNVHKHQSFIAMITGNNAVWTLL